jgi:arylsulfatase A-like enzyme
MLSSPPLTKEGERTAGENVRQLASIITAVLLASAVALITAIGSARSLSAVAEAPKEPPNIIFVLTDDQFPGTENAMPALKNNVTSQGVKFTDTISTYPLCCPGRATILRGQYAHNTKIYGNSPPLGGWKKFENRGEQKSTVATWLHDAGYQTGLFGKYMNNYTSLDIPPGWDRWYAWNGAKEGWNSLNDQGIRKSLRPKEADPGVSREAIGFLRSHIGRPAPVFAYVSFAAEHFPYHYAKTDVGKFEDEDVPRRPSFNEADVSDKPSNVRRLPKLSGSDVSELDQDYREGLRSLMRVDRFIGDASTLLRRKGEMDNTYFVYYTDNGALFGQHRFGHRKLQPYQEDTNFPLIVRGPGISHGTESVKLVGNHDIAPTLAQMGGASIPAFVDGRSILPVAKDPTAPWARTAILSERENNDEPPNSWDMLRMGSKVYNRYEKGIPEYYDLSVDPYQLHSALGAADTAYAPPGRAIRDYYEHRLDALDACRRYEGPGSCREAEDAPLLPSGAILEQWQPTASTTLVRGRWVLRSPDV